MQSYHNGDIGSDGGFEPLPQDRLWHAAAARRGIWEYSLPERLAELVARVNRLRDYINRSLADTPSGSPAEWVLRERREILDDRFRKLSSKLRIARRKERERLSLERALRNYERTMDLVGGMRPVDEFLASLPGRYGAWGGHDVEH